MIGTNGRIYGGTADGMFNPAVGDYSNSVVAEGLEQLSVLDYFLPPNWLYLTHKDFDLGSSSPVYFGWRNRNLLAHGAKEGAGLSFGCGRDGRERPSDAALRFSPAGQRPANLL